MKKALFFLVKLVVWAAVSVFVVALLLVSIFAIFLLLDSVYMEGLTEYNGLGLVFFLSAFLVGNRLWMAAGYRSIFEEQ